MPEMKICPNCGKEILAVAKKCKYCGTWIEPKHEFRCPICCEIIPEDSVICPVCHERLRPDPEPEIIVEESLLQPKLKISEESSESAIPLSASVKETVAGGKAKSLKWLYGVLVGIVVLGLAAFLILMPKSTDDIETLGDKGYISEKIVNGRSSAAEVDDVDERDFGGYGTAAEDIQASGYLTSDNGKKYGIDMELTILAVADEDDSFPVSGSYHYASQSPDNRIGLEGAEYSGQRGLSQVILFSDGGTERFDLALDREKRIIDGYWYQFEDELSCHTDGAKYLKKFSVELNW